MFDLRENPFHLLDVAPEATKAEIMDACEDAAANGRADERKLRTAAGQLCHPRKRLACEMSSLWGVSRADRSAIWKRMDGGEFDIADEDLPPLARANLAAHLCASAQVSSDNDRRQMVEWLIEARESVVEAAVLDEFNAARKRAGIPQIGEEHLPEVVRELRRTHLASALNAVEKAEHSGKLMTGIVEEWRYAKTPGGIFVREMVEIYGRRSDPILRPIREKIHEAAEELRRNPDNGEALAAIERGLAEWDEHSQPVQLKEEAKGLDERESLKLYHDLRGLALYLANKKDKYGVSLKISNALLRTFLELPTVREQLADDIKTLKELAANEKLATKRNELKRAIERKDSESARKAALEISVLTDNEDERRKAREFASQMKSGGGGGIPWWVWLIGAAILYSLFSK